MSSDALPISPARFSEALKDLPLSTLHLKAAELRNSIAHLDYSNEQLKPFADGTDPSTNGEADQVCLDAIKENEVVIARFEERIELLRKEVEGRGCSWLEFQTPSELPPVPVPAPISEATPFTTTQTTSLTNSTPTPPTQPLSSAWTDGTFQTGRIVDGDIVMDNTNTSTSNGVSTSTNTTINRTTTNGTTTGGRLNDESLRLAMEERMRALETGDDEEDGMHL